MLFPSELDNFLDEVVLLYDKDQNNQTAINMISDRCGTVNLPPVQWEDLGCFDDISI